MIKSVVDAVRGEIHKMPKDLQESGLAAAALDLAFKLETASARDSAGIAKELRTTLSELRAEADKEISEEHPIESLRNTKPYIPASTN